MIKCKHSLVELDAMAEIFYRDINKELEIKRKLANWPNDFLKPVMQYLHKYLREVIKGQPADLERHIPHIQNRIVTAKAAYHLANPILRRKNGNQITSPSGISQYLNRWLNTNLFTVFNYDKTNDGFTQIDKGQLAYRHAKRLKINSCPYCNAHFTYTIKNKNSKSRPQFDHFLDKGTYPYFAISFYNLIPCCSTCNSSGIKGHSPFLSTTHLHPFIDDMEGQFQFTTKIKAVDFLVNGEDFNLLLRPVNGSTVALRSKAKASIDSLALNERYKNHRDYAEDIIKKAYVYNNTAIEALYTGLVVNGVNLFSSISEIKELAMGNYLHPDNFHKRIFSKLTKDIAEEFGLTI